MFNKHESRTLKELIESAFCVKRDTVLTMKGRENKSQTRTEFYDKDTYIEAAQEIIFFKNWYFYVVPYTPNNLCILKRAGFNCNEAMSNSYDHYFFVPPEGREEEWENWNKEARKGLNMNFQDPADEIMAKCYKMPETGVTVECHDGIMKYTPFSETYIGYYAIRNGIIAFVSCSGITAISIHVSDVQKALEEKDYVEMKVGMWVPFANGERPCNVADKFLWNLMEKAK